MPPKPAMAELMVGDGDPSGPPKQSRSLTSQLGEILTFMRSQFDEPDFGYDFSLVRITDTGPPAILCSRVIPKDKRADRTILESESDRIGSFFFDFATQNISNYKMPQRYGVSAFDKKKQGMGMFEFTKFPTADGMVASDGTVSESATEHGLISQAMRHIELSSATGYKVHKDGHDLQDRVLSRVESRFDRDRADWRATEQKLRERIETLEKGRDEQLRLREVSLNEQLERDIIREREAAKNANTDRLWRAVFSLGPIWLKEKGVELPPEFAMMMAGQVPPQLGSGQTAPSTNGSPSEQMESLFKSLSPEQKATIIGCMTQEQAQVLVSIMKSWQSTATNGHANGTVQAS